MGLALHNPSDSTGCPALTESQDFFTESLSENNMRERSYASWRRNESLPHTEPCQADENPPRRSRRGFGLYCQQDYRRALPTGFPNPRPPSLERQGAFCDRSSSAGLPSLRLLADPKTAELYRYGPLCDPEFALDASLQAQGLHCLDAHSPKRRRAFGLADNRTCPWSEPGPNFFGTFYEHDAMSIDSCSTDYTHQSGKRKRTDSLE